MLFLLDIFAHLILYRLMPTTYWYWEICHIHIQPFTQFCKEKITQEGKIMETLRNSSSPLSPVNAQRIRDQARRCVTILRIS